MVIDIPCLINGQWLTSERTKTLKDFEGTERVRLHGATPVHVRNAKRVMAQVRAELAATPLSVLLRVVRSAAKEYCADATDVELIARLSGSPITYVKESVAAIQYWLQHIDAYLENAFGVANYEHVPVTVGATEVGYRKHVPSGPVIAILPANDDSVPAYVLAQLFLSKNPSLVKPSSHGASAFAAERFLHALHAAILREAPDRTYLTKALQMAILLEEPGTDRTEQVVSLGIEGCTYVVFGSDDSVAQISKAVERLKPRQILKLGTGFSVSVILADANLGHTLNEVYDSITEDRGNKCTTTHGLYVHEQVYAQVRAELLRLSQVPHAFTPLDPRARMGVLDEETRASVDRRLAERAQALSAGFRFYELEEHEPVEELPGPIVFVKKIRSVEHFCALLAADRAKNLLEWNLVTSVYTEDERNVDLIASKLPAHVIKWNINSNAINLFIEHQSLFLVRRVMQATVVEYFHARKVKELTQEVRT
ncbi:MAG TPA: aldehyde dehydrogenase family protein [Candidatus Binatia bacterium]|nr:aldehyde dehydrogenase family protein [Candidatus Binatia bacterium]